MPTSLQCPQGHQWEADATPTPESNLCPICGGFAQTFDAGALQRNQAPVSTRMDDAPAPTPPQTMPTAGLTWPPAPPVAPTGPRYVPLRFHAKGGLGEVHLAADTELNREVALKRIQDRFGDDTDSRRRFLVEAEVTARLEHPGVVPVYGLIPDATGRPCYAMRFIQGDSLADAIKKFHGIDDRERRGVSPPVSATGELTLRRSLGFDSLEFRQLLQRFIAVCNTIAYAHSRGVIHRDIKPGNIMLGKYGETLVVDWGLAKTVGRDEAARAAGEDTIRPEADAGAEGTATGQTMGTPVFMSPEQAAGDWRRVGPASDIYSLGATLYTLLTGHSPIRGKDVGEILLRVQRGDFPHPRQVQPQVPKPLEAVCLKAMALKPEDRYATPLDLAADLEHWLADEPVSAYREPVLVRAGRWARKHKAVVATAAAVLLTATVGLAVGLFFVNAEKDRTELARQGEEAQRIEAQARAEGEKKANAQAQKRLAQIEKGNEIITSIFTDLDPRAEEKEGKPLRAILGDRLTQAAAQLEGESVGDPLLVADLQNRLGLSLVNLGMADRAISLFAKARATQVASLGADHPDTLDTTNNLAHGYQSAGKLDQALPLWEETFQMRKAKLGPDHNATLTSMANLALGYKNAGKLDQALPLYEENLKLTKAKRGADHPFTLTSMNNLAMGHQAAGKLDQALALLEETFQLSKANLGAGHVDTLVCAGNLAMGYQAAGKLDRALPLYEETLMLMKAKLGADHPYTLTSMANLARGFQAAGKLDQALPLHEEMLRLRKAKLGADHPETMGSMNNLAAVYYAAAKLDQALPLWEETLQLRKAKLGADHPDTLGSMSNLALAYRDAEKLDRALPLFQEAAAGMEKRRFQHQYAGLFVDNLIRCHEQLKQFDQAEAWRRKWLAVVKERSGADSPPYAGELAALGLNLLQQKKWTDAEAVLRECLAIREKTQPDAWTTFNAKSWLGGALLGQKKYADAEPLLVAGYAGMIQREDKIPAFGKTRLTEALERLVQLYEAWGKPDEAAKWRKELAARIIAALHRHYAWPLLWGWPRF